MEPCASLPDLGLVGGLLATVDCHIKVLVHDSYQELVGPDTWFGTAFLGLLTIYIALLGYQLLLGRGGLRVTDLPVTAVKIGLVMAFLTSWAAYQTVVFDLLFDGPQQILQALLAPMARRGLGFDGNLYQGLENAYIALTQSAAAYGQMASPSANILQGGPMLGSGLLWMAAIGLLLSTVGLILAAKIVLGFLLAVGPVFVGLFLFDTTRGLFDGWLRTTIGFALVPLAASVFGAGALMMLDPMLRQLVANAGEGVFDMGPIMAILLIVLVFGGVMGMAVQAGASMAGGFSTPRAQTQRPAEEARSTSSSYEAGPNSRAAAERAEALAGRAARLDRDVSIDVFRSEGDTGRRTGAVVDAVSAGPARVDQQRLGQAYRRTAQPPPTRERGA